MFMTWPRKWTIFCEQGQVFQMQTGNGQLEVSEKYILRNESAPPRTRMGDHSFEITLASRRTTR